MMGVAIVAMPIFLAESASTRSRGRIAVLYQVATSLGCAMGYLLAGSGQWRLMFADRIQRQANADVHQAQADAAAEGPVVEQAKTVAADTIRTTQDQAARDLRAAQIAQANAEQRQARERAACEGCSPQPGMSCRRSAARGPEGQLMELRAELEQLRTERHGGGRKG
jgi:Sugar (and other) transporter